MTIPSHASCKKISFSARRVFPLNPKLFFHITYLLHYPHSLFPLSHPPPVLLTDLFSTRSIRQRKNQLCNHSGKTCFPTNGIFRDCRGGGGCGLMIGKGLGVNVWECGIFTLWRRPWMFFVGDLTFDFWCVALWSLYFGASIFVSRAFLWGGLPREDWCDFSSPGCFFPGGWKGG